MDKAYAVIFDETNSNLIFPIKRDGLVYGGMPQFFGGTKKPGESDRECIEREMQEESDGKLSLLKGKLHRVHMQVIKGMRYKFYVTTNFAGNNYLGPLTNPEMQAIDKFYVEEDAKVPDSTAELLERLKIDPTVEFVDSATYSGFNEALEWCWKEDLKDDPPAPVLDDSLFINTHLNKLERSLGIVANLELEYNHPLNVPQNYSAKGKTTQNTSVLSIQNTSAAFSLTVFVSPDVPNSTHNGVYTINANDATPLRLVNNWNGSILSISNISQEAATAKVTIV